jgi:hypothetical protein
MATVSLPYENLSEEIKGIDTKEAVGIDMFSQQTYKNRLQSMIFYQNKTIIRQVKCT